VERNRDARYAAAAGQRTVLYGFSMSTLLAIYSFLFFLTVWGIAARDDTKNKYLSSWAYFFLFDIVSFLFLLV
jgi:hypothetical protein